MMRVHVAHRTLLVRVLALGVAAMRAVIIVHFLPYRAGGVGCCSGRCPVIQFFTLHYYCSAGVGVVLFSATWYICLPLLVLGSLGEAPVQTSVMGNDIDQRLFLLDPVHHREARICIISVFLALGFCIMTVHAGHVLGIYVKIVTCMSVPQFPT